MKFSLEWLSDFADTAAAGGPAGTRADSSAFRASAVVRSANSDEADHDHLHAHETLAPHGGRYEDILDAIGHTPLVEISRMSPNPRVRILAKLERVFALQDEIAQRIGAALKLSLGVSAPVAATAISLFGAGTTSVGNASRRFVTRTRLWSKKFVARVWKRSASIVQPQPMRWALRTPRTREIRRSGATVMRWSTRRRRSAIASIRGTCH